MELLGLAASPLAYKTATFVAQKTFGMAAGKMLTNISAILVERFKNNQELVKLRDELSLKVNIVSLPLETCVSHAARGNTTLQPVLEAALSVLDNIEELEESLQNQDANFGRANSKSTLDETSKLVQKRLQALIHRLDSLIPYLGIAISSVCLPSRGEAEISLSRLLIASKYIQESRRLISGKVFSIPHVKLFSSREFSEGQDSVVETKFPLCQIDLVRQVSPLESTADSRQKVGDDESFNYHLQFTQGFNDGLHHEDDDSPGRFSVDVGKIIGLEWSSSLALKVGDDPNPALVIYVSQTSGSEASWSRNSSKGSQSNGTNASKKQSMQAWQNSKANTGQSPQQLGDLTMKGLSVKKIALQISQPPVESEDESPIKSVMNTPGHIASSSDESLKPQISTINMWTTLGELEYALNLCRLEAWTRAPHHTLKDEVIRSVFQERSTETHESPDGNARLEYGGKTPAQTLSGPSTPGNSTPSLQHLSSRLDTLNFAGQD